MIITAGKIAYNGVTALSVITPVAGAPVSGYQLESLDISQIENAQFIEKRAQQAGENVGDAYSGKRILTIKNGIYGSTLGDFADKVEGWMAAFNAPIAIIADTASKNTEVRTTSQGFLPLTFTLPTANIAQYPVSSFPNGIPLQFFARPMASPRMVELIDAQGGIIKKGTAVMSTVQLLLREPFAVSQALHSADITADCTGVVVKGNAPTSLILQIAISAQSTQAAGIQNVWVATANNNVDQISAAAAAAKITAPLLLSDVNSAPGPTTDELTALKPYTIYIAGGTATVDAATALVLGGYAVNSYVREGGNDRFDTSAIIANTSFSASKPVPAVWVYSGDAANFPDGIGAGFAAAAQGTPAMALTGTVLTALETAALIAISGMTATTKIMIVGTTDQVTAAMASALAGYGISVTRLGGADRYATNLLVSQNVFTGTAANVMLVTGTSFPDGCVAASLAKYYNGPVLLCNGTLTATLKAELKRLAPTKIIMIGGTLGLSDSLKAALAAYATTVVRYAGTNRYTTAVAVLQNTATLLSGGGLFIRKSNWTPTAPFGVGPFTIANLSADDTTITQSYIFNPFENIMFSVAGGPGGPHFQHYIQGVADEVPPGTGGSNVSSTRDAAFTSIIAYWRDRFVF